MLPEQVHEAHHDDAIATLMQRAAVPLDVARQQQHERQHEVADDERQRSPTASRRAMRVRYQGISSGRFADQMIRNCENEKYAHSITKASISLPRSWKCVGPMTRATSARCATAAPRTAIVKASADSPWPPMNSMPEDRREPVRVERHHPVDRRERDRQGVDHEPAAAQPLHLQALAVLAARAPARSDQLRQQYASAIQMAK